MKKLLLTSISVLALFATQAQNVGIGTNNPQTKLQVEGAISSTPVSVAAAATVTIPDNTSVFMLTATAGVQANALGMGIGREGQYLTIYNSDDDAATFAGQTIVAGGSATFNYIGGSWRLTAKTGSTGAGGTLDEAYDFGGAGAGKTITADAGAVSVQGTDGFQVSGTFNSGATIGSPGAGTRMFFNPRKAAFRAGSVDGTQWNTANVGVYSTAMGSGTIASGNSSVALGNSTTAIAPNSTAIGYLTVAGGGGATAIGSQNTASGSSSLALGNTTTASGFSSTTMGNATIASGDYSTAIGNQTSASNFNSTAMGTYTNASGSTATAMGSETIASGETSTAMGGRTTASGIFSTAMGYSTTASGNFSSAIGVSTNATGSYATAMGFQTTASGSYATAMGFQTTAIGNNSTAMGANAIASGGVATAMGFQTTASGNYATAMGGNAIASGGVATAMGNTTTASGLYSTAMGSQTTASGSSSLALGNTTTASGVSSTAMGNTTTASGDYATAMGLGTLSKSFAEIALGANNTDYTPLAPAGWNTDDRLLVVGNGTSTSSRSNAMVILKNGNTGIGSTPDPSAKLDISAANAGVLFPRVNLVSGTDAITIPSPARGLVIWNTGVSFGSPALYVNTGTSGSPTWDRVSTSAGTVTTVTASSPLSSSGGTSPNISLTGTVPVANGGTGLTTIGAGQVLIGTSSGTYLNTTLTGTANQVNINSISGAVTLSTPQDIAPSSSPSFTKVTATGANINSIEATGSIRPGTTTATAAIAGTGAVRRNGSNLEYSDGTNWRILSTGGTVTNVTGTAPISVATGTTTPVISVAANSSTSAGVVATGSGQNSQVWKTDASGNPGWRPDANSGGTVTSVGLTMPSGFTVSSSPITTSGTIGVTTTLNGPIRGNGSGFTTGNTSLTSEVTGVLPIANGGTNTTATPTNGGISYGTGSAYAFTAAGTAGNVLQSNGAAAPTWVSGDGLFIRNQTTQQTSANFNIAGAGVVGTTMTAASYLFPAPAGDPSPVITSRTVPAGQGNANEKTELILFHSNDPVNGSGNDQITLRAPALSFQTYNNATVADINNSAGYNERMYINPDGNVGIGTTGPVERLDVAGNMRATGQLFLNNVSPTIYLQDNDHRSGMIHMNGNLLYFLSANGTNSTTWATNGGYWPQTINMLTDEITFGGAAYFMEGNVGIGTTTPGFRLDVNGNMQAAVYNTSLGSGNVYELGDDAWLADVNIANSAGIRGNQDGTYGRLYFGNNNASLVGYSSSGTSAGAAGQTFDGTWGALVERTIGESAGMFAGDNWLDFWAADGIARFRDEDAIGTVVAFINQSGTIFQASDPKLKQNIQPLTNALSRLNKINTYSYEFKLDPGEAEKGDVPEKAFGVLATELQREIPELVSEMEGTKLVNYVGLVPFVLQGIKEQQAQIDQLKYASVSTESAALEQLKERVAKIEQENTELKALIKNLIQQPTNKD